MSECDSVVLLGFAVFFGCICIGFGLAATALPECEEHENKEPPDLDGSLKG